MKQLREQTRYKVLAVVLCVLMLAGTVLSGAGILFLGNYDAYQSPDLARETILQRTTWNMESHLYDYIHSIYKDYSTNYYDHLYDEANTNFFFRVTDEQGEVILENYWREESLYDYETTMVLTDSYTDVTVYPGEIFTADVNNWNKAEERYEYCGDGKEVLYKYDLDGGLWDMEHEAWGNWYYDGMNTNVEVFIEENTPMTLHSGVAADLHADDEYKLYLSLLDYLLPMQNTLIVMLVVCGLLSLVCLTFLLWATGHKTGVEGLYLAPWHKPPLDLTAAVVVCLGLGGCFPLAWLGHWVRQRNYVLGLGLGIPVATALALLMIYSLVTLTARIKAKTWWRNTIIWRVLCWCGRWIARLFRVLPLVWKTALACAGVALMDLLVMFGFGYGISEIEVLYWFLRSTCLSALVLYIAWQMQVLKKSGKALAAGDLSHRTDTSKLILDLKQHGQDLNCIGDGMNAAVDARMKSERLKTELITNVSHDLKTPLTSIVNYVDLMQQLPELQPEQAREYLEVLERQSARLKKLTEDLVEASKASSGAMACHPVPTNLQELIRQATGEYEQKLEAAGLNLVLELPAQCTVLADGRLLWRVLDNLLNNCCKYAMPGTRVYLKVTTGQTRAAIILKNISREPLDLDAEALMERFVRGDASRSTEGSGLGLSIARSLTQLQQGTFKLHIDGDLFKAELTLPLAEETT